MSDATQQPLTPSRIAVEFGSFLQAQNIAGLSIGFLIASSTLDTAKNVVSTSIMPLVQSMQTLKPPKFDFSPLVQSLMTFLITMFLCFVILKVGRVKPQAVSLVQVIN